IDESDSAWPRISEWATRRSALDMVSSHFSPEEIAEAEWLGMDPRWHWSYPQPEDDFGFRSVTYDLSQYCSTCGIGAVQKAAFRMKSEPRWGRNGILQLNWVFDEYFVRPEVWKSIFEPLRIASRPVVDKEGRELATVLQLKAPEAVVPVSTEGLKAKLCGVCGRTKYGWVVRGPFPSLLTAPVDAHLFKTKEYFGDGAAADKAVLVSQAPRRALEERAIRGVSFLPVAAQPGTRAAGRRPAGS